MTRIKISCIFASLINQTSSYMETTNNNGYYRSARMDKLAVGDIFLFFADGYKYVFLGLTPDGKFCYRRCEMRSRRKHYSQRNLLVFVKDNDGDVLVGDGKLFVNYK